MGVLGRARAPEPPAPGPKTCVACTTTTGPMETIVREGMDLIICVHPTPCRRRAERAGAWKR